MHNLFMRRCLELAEGGRGKTGTNPMVGAVLVRDGIIIAEGYHDGFGSPHAEADLINKFDPTSPSGLRRASQEIQQKDVLYVNLEPCCHTSKKTPPCAQMLVEKGIRNVVIGMRDPNPEVSGKGIEFLRSNGASVTLVPQMLAECVRLNRGFVSLQTKDRPWITVKEAVTLDRKHAQPDGSRLKITSEEQDIWAHRFLRARHDAILVGVGTILKDDPQLTVRHGEGKPFRLVLDPHIMTPLTARIVTDALVAKTIIVVAPDADKKKVKELQSRGVRIFEVPLRKQRFDWPKLWQCLSTPRGDFHGICSILVEGGSKTWGVFRNEGIVDEEVTLVGARKIYSDFGSKCCCTIHGANRSRPFFVVRNTKKGAKIALEFPKKNHAQTN